MTGFLNNDGSGLVGGQLPSGAGQALQLDNSGNLKTTASLTPPANQRVSAQSGDFVDGAIVTLGTEADAAWTLSGNATIVALLKKLDLLLQNVAYDNTNELKSSLYGKGNGAAGDTAMLLDSAGHLLPDMIDRWARQVGQVDFARFNGAAVGATNPILTQDQIRSLILAGKGFTLITRQTAGAAGNFGIALYNPSGNGKTVVIYSIRIFENQSAGVHEVHLTTSDPAFGNALTPINSNAGNGNTSGCTGSYASASQTIPGTGMIAFSAQNTNGTQELLSNGDIIVLPSGANNGLGVYINLGATGGWGAEIGYVEY